jgi:hypothetical protein
LSLQLSFNFKKGRLEFPSRTGRAHYFFVFPVRCLEHVNTELFRTVSAFEEIQQKKAYVRQHRLLPGVLTLLTECKKEGNKAFEKVIGVIFLSRR